MTMMAMRLGHVLGWTANLIALVIFGISVAIAVSMSDRPDVLGVSAMFAVFAGLIWLAGRALRYILAGR